MSKSSTSLSDASRFRSKLVFAGKLPKPSAFGREAVLIHDRRLARLFPFWIRSFRRRYPVTAGEGLKSIDRFPGHARKIVKLMDGLSRDTVIVIAGGGSVGDFGAFLASVLKRGLPCVHIPSTWVSALDSSHGGKTALNVGGAKNQLGTFHPAREVYLIKELLASQPRRRAEEALGELLKMAILSGGGWSKSLGRSERSPEEELFASLKPAIAAKRRVIARDPLDQGFRAVLNFGHTLGHVLESYHGIAHGEAVHHGLRFAIEWSRERGYLRGNKLHSVHAILKGFRSPKRPSGLIPRSAFRRLLGRDKKRVSGEKLRFVFIEGVGRPRLVNIPLKACLKEAVRQKWVSR